MKRREVDFSAPTNNICNSVSCNTPIKRSVSRKKVDSVSSLNVEGTSKKVGLCQGCTKFLRKLPKKTELWSHLVDECFLCYI